MHYFHTKLSHVLATVLALNVTCASRRQRRVDGGNEGEGGGAKKWGSKARYVERK